MIEAAVLPVDVNANSASAAHDPREGQLLREERFHVKHLASVAGHELVPPPTLIGYGLTASAIQAHNPGAVRAPQRGVAEVEPIADSF